VREINIGADRLISALLGLSETEQVCILDSCGVGHLGSHLLVAGVSPVESFEISGGTDETLRTLDQMTAKEGQAAFLRFRTSSEESSTAYQVSPLANRTFLLPYSTAL
jgi:hypothetical protein